ncbi:hypothetical protein ACWC24_37565 [Streptomyces sp. NPDC001443]
MFPSPGTDHTYPDTRAPLRACATSGLPVSYAYEPQENCHTEGGQVVLNGTTGSCTVIASQPGDSAWAPARAVRREFRVGPQWVTASWADPPVRLSYPGVTVVRVRIAGSQPFNGFVEMTTAGACGFGDGSSDRTSVTLAAPQTLVSVSVVARDPRSGGQCTLDGYASSNHGINGYLSQRTYTIVARGGASSSSADGSPSPS